MALDRSDFKRNPPQGQKRGRSNMASFQGVIGNIGMMFSAVETQKANYREIYEENCHRIYSLGFWMTDNELIAEQLLNNTFLRAFSGASELKAESIDRAFIAEMRETFAIGSLTLSSPVDIQGSS